MLIHIQYDKMAVPLINCVIVCSSSGDWGGYALVVAGIAEIMVASCRIVQEFLAHLACDVIEIFPMAFDRAVVHEVTGLKYERWLVLYDEPHYLAMHIVTIAAIAVDCKPKRFSRIISINTACGMRTKYSGRR